MARRARRELDLVLAALAALLAAAPLLAAESARGAPLGGDLVLAWNQLGWELAVEKEAFLTFAGQRAQAMTNLAMHDALNAVEPRFRGYAFFAHEPGADALAAAAQAAHDVLAAAYPDARERIATELAGALERLPDGEARARGIALGRRSAAAILGARQADGWDFEGDYEALDRPGRFRPTPQWNGYVLKPGFRYARPFALESPDQLRPPPPPPLDSDEYRGALEEVRDYGAGSSAMRSADQSGYAVWWMEFAEGSVARLARQLAARERLDAWQAARLLALLNLTLYDTYVAVWDSKFEYALWRPGSAIRIGAGRDGGDWQPLRPVPPFPDYVSAHAAACAASFSILDRFFDGAEPFTMTTTTAPPDMPERRFQSFEAAAAECADSRIRLGWHFRFAADRGLELGRAVADYVAEHALAPRRSAPPGRSTDQLR